ncbi:hypothetical protein COO60DRAFT_1520342 [Scenedesmus sp. NREL 46B-D3]|nr:hypothetical protein COO60DRAFT_1520342 [Scenedesmus sp. NREL 46B-D3]
MAAGAATAAAQAPAPAAAATAGPAATAAGANATADAAPNEIAGLTLESYGQLQTLWLTVFIFGNAFAVFWLARAFLNAHPHIAYQVRCALAKVCLGGRRQAKQVDGAAHSHQDAMAAGRKMPGRPVTANVTAAAAAGHAAIELSPSVGPARGASPIICTPSAEVQGDGHGASDAAAPEAAAGGAALARGSSSDDSGSSYSSDGESTKLPVQLQWVNMCYSVKTAAGRKHIIQGIYGCARPRELQGLLGPSGAGKSTLMDLLAMRTDHDGAAAVMPGSSGGDDDAAAVPGPPSVLLVNGVEVKRQDFMAISAYVPQHDNLVPTMTAIESVSFYAAIVLPPDMSKGVRRARIARVLRMMGLSHAQNTLVGGTLPGGIMLRGMSGGERKRLAIACGVVAGPSLVFLDEPTSGLDSFAALNVVLFLKSMATEQGATLLASLHQPRAAIWSQMDQITLLSSGRLMYTGPTEQLVPWFTSLGYAYDHELHGMASDWALDLVSLGFTKPQQDEEDGAAAPAPAGEHTAVLQAADQKNGSASSRMNGSMGGQSDVARSGSVYYSMTGSSNGCMMTSKQELNEAAAAFIAQLQQTQPEWFSERRALVSVVVPSGATARPPLTASAGVHANGRASAASEEPAGASTQPPQGTPPARPSASRWYLPADAQAAAPYDAQPYSCESPKSEHSATSSRVLMRDQVPSSAAAPAAAGPASKAGKPKKALSLVQEASPFIEQQGMGTAGAPVGLEGRQRLGLWMRLLWALAKYRALLWRELLITTRNPADVGGRMMTFTYVSAISGICSWSLTGGAESMFQRLSVCYAVLTFYFLMPFVFMSIFTSDKRFFAADTAARLYHPLQYYLSKVTVTLPFNIIVALVFHLVYYGMAGMRHSAVAMAASGLICVLTGLIGMQAVYCCAIMASSQDLAFVYAIGWTALNLLVNPYMSLFDQYSLGWGWSWLRFLSPNSFAWQGLVFIEFNGRGFDCNSGSGTEAVGLIPALIPQTSAFDVLRNNLGNLGRLSTGGRCVASGDAIVEMYTMGLDYWPIVGILIGFYVLFLLATYLVVKRSARASLKV